MKKLPSYQQTKEQPERELVLNNASDNDSVASMNMTEPQRAEIDPAMLARADQQATGYKPFIELKVDDYLAAPRIDASKLQASSHLRNHIRKLERYVPKIANDGFGNPTGGFGHTKWSGSNRQIGDPVSTYEAELLLARDIEEAERTVKRLVGNLPLRQNEYDALVDLAFNVGAPALNRKNSPYLNQAIEDKNYNEIGKNLRYTLANGVYSEGLGNRSKSRIDLYTLGIYARRYD